MCSSSSRLSRYCRSLSSCSFLSYSSLVIRVMYIFIVSSRTRLKIPRLATAGYRAQDHFFSRNGKNNGVDHNRSCFLGTIPLTSSCVLSRRSILSKRSKRPTRFRRDSGSSKICAMVTFTSCSISLLGFVGCSAGTKPASHTCDFRLLQI